MFPPRRTAYQSVRNLAVGGEPKLYHIGIVQMHAGQYYSSQYDTGVAA